MPWFIRWIDDSRIAGVQSTQPVDEGAGFRGAFSGRFTDWMVPNERMDISFDEESSNGRYTGLQREFCSPPEVQDTFFWICGRSFGMDERPTLVENSSSEFFRNIDGIQVGRAEGGDKEHELQIRHSGMLDIKRLHIPVIIDRDGD